MVEIMLVVSLMAVLLAIIVPRYRYHVSVRDQSNARDNVSAMLTYARQAAVERGGTTLSVSTSGTTSTFVLKQTSSSAVLRTYVAPSEVSVQTPGGQTVFTFSANGSVSTGGTFTYTVASAPNITATLDATTGNVVNN